MVTWNSSMTPDAFTRGPENHDNVTMNTSMSETVSVVSNMEALTMTRFYVQRLLVPIVTAAGLVGNIISSCVLTRKSMITSTNCYLTALAVFDTLYLVFSFTLSFEHYDVIRGLDIYWYWNPFGRVLTDFASNVSVLLTVTFTLERYVGVCHPMKGRVLCTPKRANYIIVAVVLSAFICTTPEFFEWRTFLVTDEHNQTKVKLGRTELAYSYSYSVGYSWFLVSIFTFLPLILLCTFNGILIHSVLVATRIRKRMAYMSMTKEPRRQKEQMKITMMLISVVAVFIFCQFPNAAVIVYNTYIEIAEVEMTEADWNNVKIAGNIVNLLILVNASGNCLLYSIMSSKFRRIFLRVFCSFIPKYNTQYTRTESYFHSLTVRSQPSPSRYVNSRINNNTIRNGYIKRQTCHSANSLGESSTSAYCQQEMTLHRNGSIHVSLRFVNGSGHSDSEETSTDKDINLQLLGSEFNEINGPVQNLNTTSDV